MTLVKNEYELNQALRVLENYTASRDMKFYAVYMEVNVKDNVLADKYLQFIEDENGQKIWKQGSQKDNQDIAIKNIVKRQIKLLQDTLEAHGGNIRYFSKVSNSS